MLKDWGAEVKTYPIVPDRFDAIRDMLARETGDVYVVTCFSDRDKFLSRLPADAAERREISLAGKSSADQ